MLIDDAEKLLVERDVEAALTAFDRAEAAGDDIARCRGGRWQAYMLLGQFESAWRESDALNGLGETSTQRFWQGEDWAGKRVMLRCLHGLGDAVQFLRYAPALASQAAQLIVQVPPAMLSLATYFEGVGEVITWGDADRTEPEWQVQVEINELPYLFRTQLSDLPISARYLRLPARTSASKSKLLSDRSKCHVGVVWSCGSWNPTRAVPFHLVSSLFNTPDCVFWNLESDATQKKGPGHPALHTVEGSGRNLVALAQLIAQLDLVVTADTLAAHLAGALGTTAFVLLPHAADWRWLHGRSDSPWYPKLRLFRQSRPGEWDSAIQDVQAAVLECSANRQMA